MFDQNKANKVVIRKAHMIRGNIHEPIWECMSTLETSPRGCCCKFVAFPGAGVMFFEFSLRGPSDLLLVATTA